MAEPVVLERASVLCYRLFDVGDRIDLARVEKQLVQPGRRLQLTREGSQFVVLPEPPVTLELEPRNLKLGERELRVAVRARLFDLGAASIVLTLEVPPGMTLDALVPWVDELSDSPAVDQLAKDVLLPLRDSLGPAIEAPHLWEQNEGYTVVFAERIRGNPDAESLMQSEALPKLMLADGKVDRLSRREREDAVEQCFSYTDRDLAVIDWNGAFVFEPSGSRDVPDMLEIVNAQLLELRFYDDVLDGQLQRTYGALSDRHRSNFMLVWSPYRQLMRQVSLTVLELSELVERVENSLKIVGDAFLAKVYEGAVKQLRIAPWQASVERKQQLLSDTYELLRSEVDTDRIVTLDVMIVVLILVEIVLALFIGR
ncbi:MAG: hypothetical protein ACKVPX_10975 [Myxococcaceae bacterium]